VSILVHELGHIWMGRLFGTTGHIVLCSFYGLAVPHEPLHNRWQRIAVSFAGPGAGFVLLGIVFAGAFAVNQLLQDETPFWFRLVVAQLIWINLVWGLVNLLPVWPLDGGQISRELFEGYVRPNGLRISLIVSLVVAAVFAINSLSGLLRGPTIPYLPTGSLLSVLFFGFLALGSYQLLQMTPPAGGGGGRYRVEQESYERAPWERDADWWKRS
jgi:Zn-dependent protease